MSYLWVSVQEVIENHLVDGWAELGVRPRQERRQALSSGTVKSAYKELIRTMESYSFY